MNTDVPIDPIGGPTGGPAAGSIAGLDGDGAAPVAGRARLAGCLAVAAALAFAVLLSVRPLSSPDLGYHLAYGEQTLDTGRPVDHNPYIYTLPAGDSSERPSVGPGCWYDADGCYRFPNANWLTQVVMAGVHCAGGINGLIGLQVALVVGIFLTLARLMARLGVPAALLAGGLILVALTSYERFNLRPELFGYLLLVVQLALLVERRMNWLIVAGLIALQLLFVNLHSYFLLGLILTACMLAQKHLQLAWGALRRGPSSRSSTPAEAARAGADAPAELPRQVKLLWLALTGQLLACLVNPWTWRLAVLPIQTLVFINDNSINAGTAEAVEGHPWAMIGEFFRPLAGGGFMASKATYGFYVVLGLAGLAMLACVLRKQARRWSWLMILAIMTAVSLSMRRNIAPAAMVIVPLALAALWPIVRSATMRLSRSSAQWASLVGACLVLLAGAALSLRVASQDFYYADRSPSRLGLGMRELEIPIGVSRWLNQQRPDGRVWTDYGDSSNLYYFTQPHRDVPIVTNTWAYPPEVMRTVLDSCQSREALEQAVRQYNVEILALRVDQGSSGLVQSLLLDQRNPATSGPSWRRWKLVYLDQFRVVFLPVDGPNAALAQRAAITPATLDLAAYKKSLLEQDSVPAYATFVGAVTLFHMGWYDQAIALMNDSLGLDPSYAPAWNWLGLCYVRRGNVRMDLKDSRALADLREGMKCFQQALASRGDFPEAKINLGVVRGQIEQYR